jgi:hypothetical protein
MNSVESFQGETARPGRGRPRLLRTQRGVTMLEFVFAMAIFTVGFLSLSALVFRLDRMQLEAERHSTATHLATSLMEQLLANKDLNWTSEAMQLEVRQSYGEIPGFPELRTYYIVEGPPSSPEGLRRLRVGALWLRGPGREATTTGEILTDENRATVRGTVELQCLVF